MARVLSGIQSSGRPHIGNYLGAMKRHVELQNEHECFYFIANLHSLTTIKDANLEKQLTMDVALDYLALGLDPAKTVLFKQSDVPAHSELAWILSTVTPLGLLKRAHSYKDKMQKGETFDQINHGLFAYPVLMAADILLYQSDLVPVGKDQKQHLEITRDIADNFNRTYGETFKLPEPMIDKKTATILGTDGQRKMSKSYGNTIELFGSEETIKKQIMSMVTDPLKIRKNDPGRPEVCNVFTLHTFFTEKKHVDWIDENCRSGEQYCTKCKTELYEAIMDHFQPMRERRAYFEKHLGEVEEIVRQGAVKARTVAEETMSKVRKRVGIY
jgi:tryptophanyl-tRNA synthetase